MTDTNTSQEHPEDKAAGPASESTQEKNQLADDQHGNTQIEKILKERFGHPGLGNIMDTIMDEMIKKMPKK